MARCVYLISPGGVIGRGGMGRMTAYLAEAWRTHGEGRLRVVDSYGPDNKTLMPIYFLLACLRVLGAAMTGRAGLLHVNMAERGSVWRKGVFVWIGALCGVPVILHCHGADFVEYSEGLKPWRRRLLIATMNRAARVVVLGGFWRTFAVERLGLPADKVEILPNAVPEPPRALGTVADDGPVRLLFLGRLSERKGVPELLEALALLRDRPWTAVLAGDGEAGRFGEEIQRLGLAGRVRLTGWVDAAEAAHLRASSDLLVLPSRNEGLPMAILEAMANGLPVVATPVGAVEDAVTHEANGLLVPPGDAEALATALRSLIDDPLLRRRLGACARRRYAAEFSLPAHVTRLRAIYAAIDDRRFEPAPAG